jgi:flagellar motility protein MotE (MotC chaperone)
VGLKEQMLLKAVEGMSPEEVASAVKLLLPKMMESMDEEQRGEFLLTLIEEVLSTALKGMSREERARLMNKALPALLREFPMQDLDILGLFGDAAE